MWPFSTIRYLTLQWQKSLADLESSTENFKKMYQVSCEQGDMVDGLMKELEVERMKLVACGIGAMSNTPESAASQRVSVGHPYYSASAQDVYDAVDRETKLRKELEEANDRAFRASKAHIATMGKFQDALDVIGKVVKTKLQGDMRDNAQEAEKFYNLHRGTKVCVMCGCDMIPMHSEDKKMCSNGACGHEIEWKLEEGQKYQHKNNVEPFVEDRSQPEEPRTQTRF